MESQGHGVTPLTEIRGGSFVLYRFVQLQLQLQLLAQGVVATSASRPAEMTGRRMATTATSGEPTRRTGPKLRTSARGRAVIWPLSPRTPPKTLSSRG